MNPDRYNKIKAMLDQRQPDLTVCLETVHKSHNLSAIVRSCDAVGIHQVHAVFEEKQRHMSASTASGSQHWLKINGHRTIEGAITTLKDQGMQILATHLSPTAVNFRDIDYTKPTAILMGNEQSGLTDEALALADQDIIIPMNGMVQSLNVSVAAALVLFEAQRQRQAKGMYDTPQLPREEYQRILFERGHPALAKTCRRKGLPMPLIDDQGQVVADEDWWRQMKASQEPLTP